MLNSRTWMESRFVQTN